MRRGHPRDPKSGLSCRADQRYARTLGVSGAAICPLRTAGRGTPRWPSFLFRVTSFALMGRSHLWR
jgi:hypothetical protein